MSGQSSRFCDSCNGSLSQPPFQPPACRVNPQDDGYPKAKIEGKLVVFQPPACRVNPQDMQRCNVLGVDGPFIVSTPCLSGQSSRSEVPQGGAGKGASWFQPPACRVNPQDPVVLLSPLYWRHIRKCFNPLLVGSILKMERSRKGCEKSASACFNPLLVGSILKINFDRSS